MLCLIVKMVGCLQAVFHTTRGRYPLTVEEFHTQAGVQAAIKHLEEDTKSDLSAVKSEVGQFYPPHMVPSGSLKVTKFFKKSSEPKGGVVNELTKAYQEALKKCGDTHQLKILYLQLCWHKPYYGSVFFKGIVEKPPQYLKLLAANEKRIVVAVNTECVHLMAAAPPSVSMEWHITWDLATCSVCWTSPTPWTMCDYPAGPPLPGSLYHRWPGREWPGYEPAWCKDCSMV